MCAPIMTNEKENAMKDEQYSIQSLRVEKSKSTLGAYVIKLSPVTFRFYPTKEGAVKYLNELGNLETYRQRQEEGEATA